MVKVSIIVPIFKAETFLRKCIDHLCNQTLQDIEIILVDDGSPDQCPIICDEYAKQDRRGHVIHKPNGGVSAARNDGIRQAVGEYIIFCDSDDWMEENGLEIMYMKAKETNADVVIGDVYQVTGEQRKYVSFYRREFVTEDREHIDHLIQADIYRTYCPDPPEEGPAFGYGGPWNKLVRRELLMKQHIEFDVRLKGIFDDIQYTAYVLFAAKTIAYIRKPVYNYNIIGSSMTHTFKPNVLDINQAIFRGWEEFFAKTGQRKVYEKAYDACVLRRIEESIRLYFINPQNQETSAVLKKEFRRMLNEEPYRSAVRNVERHKLSKKQKIISVAGKIGMITPIWMIYNR